MDVFCRTSTKPDVASVEPILELNGKGGRWGDLLAGALILKERACYQEV